MYGKFMLGGVVSWKSYLEATNPKLLAWIEKPTAIVKAKEDENGDLYLYIEVSLIGGKHLELRTVVGDMNDEGDIVDVFSILAVFLDRPDGSVIVRYTAPCLEKGKKSSTQEITSNYLLGVCQDVVEGMNSTYKQIHKDNKKPPKSFIEAAKKSQHKKGGRQEYKRGNSYYGSYPFHEDTSERAIWDSMIDGQCGDEWVDDYEPMGY